MNKVMNKSIKDFSTRELLRELDRRAELNLTDVDCCLLGIMEYRGFPEELIQQVFDWINAPVANEAALKHWLDFARRR